MCMINTFPGAVVIAIQQISERRSPFLASAMSCMRGVLWYGQVAVWFSDRSGVVGVKRAAAAAAEAEADALSVFMGVWLMCDN